MKKLSAVDSARLVERSTSLVFVPHGAFSRQIKPVACKAFELCWNDEAKRDLDTNAELCRSFVRVVKYDLKVVGNRYSDCEVPNDAVVNRDVASPPMLSFRVI